MTIERESVRTDIRAEIDGEVGRENGIETEVHHDATPEGTMMKGPPGEIEICSMNDGVGEEDEAIEATAMHLVGDRGASARRVPPLHQRRGNLHRILQMLFLSLSGDED